MTNQPHDGGATITPYRDGPLIVRGDSLEKSMSRYLVEQMDLLILLIEGLVVSIQTTRLVLFEFFVRFLTARGRLFEPLTPPPAPLPGGQP